MTSLSTESMRARSAAATAFVHSLNILVKYARMYGFDHKRTESQFETTWNELQQAIPKAGTGGLLIGVSGNKLLLDGLPLESGQAERSFAQLLTAAGLASIHFASDVTMEDLARLVRAFTLGGSKAQDLSRQIKESLGNNDRSTIKINEVKFVAADPATGEVSVAAQIAAQTLGPEFKDWLNDPQKLLQLIAAAEGSGKGDNPGGSAPPGSVPSGRGAGGGSGAFAFGSLATTIGDLANAAGGSGTGTGTGTGGGSGSGSGSGTGSGTGEGSGTGSGTGSGSGTGTGTGTGSGGGSGFAGTVPLQEQEVVQAIRLLTRFGEASRDPQANPADLQKDINAATPNTRLSLQELLESLASTVKQTEADGSMLMKAAEHMAIRFALERYQKGDIRVNAVHQMLEHMSRQMDRLRQILRIQEDKMGKAGILVESHADILDRMFWAEVPENGKRSVLLSNEAACVPARNVRQFLETLFERADHDSAEKILRNYLSCLSNKDLEIRKKTSVGLAQLADLFGATGKDLLVDAIRSVGEQLQREQDGELQSLVSAAFVRLSQEANTRRQYAALEQVLTSLELVSRDRPLFAKDIGPRIGVETRIPEFIEEALRLTEVPRELMNVLRKTPEASVDHLAERFYRCLTREECDRVVELADNLGEQSLQQMRQTLRVGQPSKAAAIVGLLSRLDVPTLLELLPARLPEMNRFYHDMIVRQIAYGAAPDRGRTLVELLELLDPLVVPSAVDEIGMSGDASASAPVIVMAQAGEAEGRSPLLQVKAIEALGRLREGEAISTLRGLLEARKMFKWAYHRELRVAAAQSLSKIDPRYSSQILSDSSLDSAELALAPLEPVPTCTWVRQRRYERFVLTKSINATLSSSWGKVQILIRELSMGGGLASKEGNLRVGSEGNLEFSAGMRSVKAQVMLRRAKQNEFGFEIMQADLDSRYRLRRLLVEAAAKGGNKDWDGTRKG